MKELIQALARARKNYAGIEKDGSAVVKGGRTYSYMTLDSIVKATFPALADEGLHCYWTTRMEENRLIVTAHVTDGEHELTSPAYMPTYGVQESSNSAQAIGSLLTYGRRYSVASLLGIVADEDDDAGSVSQDPAAQEVKREPKPSPIKPVGAVEQVKSAVEKLKAAVEVKKSADADLDKRKQQMLDYINSQFDHYQLTIADRERILSTSKGKLLPEIVAEIQSCACVQEVENG